MERADLLEANGGIFKPQGEAIAAGAADDIKVLVVGNPANTNALIAASNADGVPKERFTAMTRLDHNRAIAQLAQKTGAAVSDITNMAIWGNHSPSMYPDLFNAKVKGERAWDAVGDEDWVAERVHPARRQARRGDHRGARRFVRRFGRERRDRPRPRLGQRHAPRASGCRWPCPSTGAYGVPEGIISSFPVTTSGGEYDDRRGPRRPRVLAGAHRQDGRRAPGGARGGRQARPGLAAARQ